ncbi:PilW family protein [Variovorax sp. J22G21]|uniref:PilW family protein n=1 Tax=Variovorax fucosicus TaxID=3053517 RepID=UPI002577DD2F|nr:MULTISPECIES: PilW family protein [unclassified Variovorax]MDM0039474.1 PilW family protein [Variovorax sp. J22R193]MDM0064249.1 PilW family protein [Variovorax sp. J22G21]
MNRLSRQRGLTLIELLISITIGLLLAAAASYLFVATNRISSVVETKSQQQESAAIVLDIIGRDLKNAGFYPADFPTTTVSSKFQGTYANVVSATVVAYNQGIFGCTGGQFDVATGGCPTPVTSEPDSLVINYFSADNFSTNGVGTRRDCLSQSVELATFGGSTYNQARAGSATGSTDTVDLPLFISNAYSLGANTTYTVNNGQTVTTRSFLCAGNGPNANPYQPLVSGITQLRFRYGVAEASTLESPARFYTATAVSALPSVDINGDIKTGWQRVVAVQVCVLSKTLDAAARQTASGSYVDCDGTTVNYTTTDRAIYRQQTRIFGIRNNLTKTF